MKLLLPVLLLILGTGAGAGAGFLLMPAAPDPASTDQAMTECVPPETQVAGEAPAHAEDVVKPIEVFDDGHGGTTTEPEYVALDNQFVVPVITGEKVTAMMVVSIAIVIPPGQSEVVTTAEPRIRDKFLQVLFSHANIGGFSGNFTSASNMRQLRQDLLRAARGVVGTTALDVLVLDMIRQDS